MSSGGDFLSSFFIGTTQRNFLTFSLIGIAAEPRPVQNQPKTSPKRPKNGPRPAKNGPKPVQNQPKPAQKQPKTSPNQPPNQPGIKPTTKLRTTCFIQVECIKFAAFATRYQIPAPLSRRTALAYSPAQAPDPFETVSSAPTRAVPLASVALPSA